MKIIANFTEKLALKVYPNSEIIRYWYSNPSIRWYWLNLNLYKKLRVSGSHIYPLFGNQSCHEDPLAKLKRQLEKAEQEINKIERTKIKVPSKFDVIEIGTYIIVNSLLALRLLTFLKDCRIYNITHKITKYNTCYASLVIYDKTP